MFSYRTLPRNALVALTLLSSSAYAEDIMNAQEFDTYTRGKTLFYGQNGAAYGAEVYLENRRVRWSFLDGQCKDGEWYEDAGEICFVYEDSTTPQCWTFLENSGGLVARFENYTKRMTWAKKCCVWAPKSGSDPTA